MDEYRLWITVPDLHLEDERDWESLIEYLERWHGDLGPILTWDGRGGATVIVALDSDSEAHAARTGVGVIADALHHTGLGTSYPQLVEVDRTLVEA